MNPSDIIASDIDEKALQAMQVRITQILLHLPRFHRERLMLGTWCEDDVIKPASCTREHTDRGRSETAVRGDSVARHQTCR